MKKTKVIGFAVCGMLFLGAGTGGAVWYSKMAHFNDRFTSQIKRERNIKESEILYKSDLAAIEKVTVTSEEELKYLMSFPNLKSVRIQRITLDVADMNTYLKRVETVSLYECNLKGQVKATSLPELRNLTLNGIKILDTAFLSSMTQIESFSNNTASTIEIDQKETVDISFLREWKELQELRLDKSTYTNAEVIKTLPKLKSLLITASSIDSDAIFCQPMNLDWLYIENINQQAFDRVCKGAKIKSFTMIILEEPEINLKNLSKIHGIEKLDISASIPLNEERHSLKEYLKARITGYDCIYKIDTLKKVEVSGCKVEVPFPKKEW